MILLLILLSQRSPWTWSDFWTLDVTKRSETTVWGHSGCHVLLDISHTVSPHVLLYEDPSQRAGSGCGYVASEYTFWSLTSAKHTHISPRTVPIPLALHKLLRVSCYGSRNLSIHGWHFVENATLEYLCAIPAGECESLEFVCMCFGT